MQILRTNNFRGGLLVPSLNLDFMRGVLPSGLSFSRASGGSYYDVNGVLQTAAVNVPRFDYDPVTLQLRGLLIEEQRTNLLLRSQELTISGYWQLGRTGYTFAENSVTAPDGTLTADQVTNTSNTNNSQGFFRDLNGIANGAYTLSVYVRAGTATSVRLIVKNAVSDTEKGATLVTNLTSTWQRITVTGVTDGTSNTGVRFELSTNGASGSIYVWGMQCEAGSFATSYIPTTTAAVTRSVDVCYMGLGNWYNFSQGSIYASFMPLTNSYNRGVFSINDNSSSNRIDFRSSQSNSFITVAGVGQLTATPPTAITVGAINKCAMSFAAGAFAIAGNGGGVATASPAAIPTNLNTFQIGNIDGIGTPQILNGYLRKISYYPRRLPNSTLQLLTQ